MSNFNFKAYMPEGVSQEEAQALFQSAIFKDGLKEIFKKNYRMVIKLLETASQAAANQFHSENVKMLYNTVIVKVLRQMEQIPKMQIAFSNNRMTFDLSLWPDDMALTKADVSAGLASMYQRAAGTATGLGGKKFQVSALANFIPDYIKYKAPLWKILWLGSAGGATIRPRAERTFLREYRNKKGRSRGNTRKYLLVGPPSQYNISSGITKKATAPIDPIILGKGGVFKPSYKRKFTDGVQHDIVRFMEELAQRMRK